MEDKLLGQVAWIGDQYLNGPVRGIVLEFSGLGTTGMKSSAEPMEMEWGQAGALCVLPYHDPWGWTNAPTRAFVDELLDGLFARYRLAPETPVIAVGPSMGGHGALLYTALGGHAIAACAANCPATDLTYHYTERPDLPRTLHHAFDSYGDISEALTAHSPLFQVDKLPDIPYLLIHGGQDTLANKAAHGDTLAAAMRARGLNLDYVERPEMGHCGPFDWALQRRMTDFVLEQL